ncbi:MAG: hypothetical protein NTW86_32820, partial [Candidatus Sumerlaeota bacterium]|nr:hypothetical protein [Candidatus Sumerlaeota bacterium]
MKIRDIAVFEVSGRTNEAWTGRQSRKVEQLDVYPEFARRDPAPVDAPRGSVPIRSIYVEVASDTDLRGLYGPLLPEQAFNIRAKLRPFLLGRDPLAG